MPREINKRSTQLFGNGLPFYTKIEHQQRYNTAKPYRDGLLVVPFDRLPTFQFKAPELFDGSVTRFDASDAAFGIVSVGVDSTFNIIRKQTSDGEYLYTASDALTSLSSPGYFYLAFRLPGDPANEYRYFSEQWHGSNCIGDPAMVV